MKNGEVTYFKGNVFQCIHFCKKKENQNKQYI